MNLTSVVKLPTVQLKMKRFKAIQTEFSTSTKISYCFTEKSQITNYNYKFIYDPFADLALLWVWPCRKY